MSKMFGTIDNLFESGKDLVIDENRIDDMKAAAERVLKAFEDSDKSVEIFTDALNEISRLNWDNEISDDIYQEYIKKIQDAYKNKDRELVTEDMSNEELVERIKQGITTGLGKCSSFTDIKGVLDYYSTFIVNQLADGEDTE